MTLEKHRTFMGTDSTSDSLHSDKYPPLSRSHSEFPNRGKGRRLESLNLHSTPCFPSPGLTRGLSGAELRGSPASPAPGPPPGPPHLHRTGAHLAAPGLPHLLTGSVAARTPGPGMLIGATPGV